LTESLRRLLSDGLKVPLSAVRIVAGQEKRTKRAMIAGATRKQVLALTAPPSKSSTRSKKD